MHSGPWQKSSYSGDGSNCVEISRSRTAIHVRDSKCKDGPYLTVSFASWPCFVQALPNGTRPRKDFGCPPSSGKSPRTAATPPTA
ncbi:DUF397 domain-containing protein [Streptomyces sp. NPDC006997]|uniref:DUF397 domain-containing protein n=1 Tax=Streptomyces sp. NPDC006997 TaxID=3155356 RepID=UPI0033DB1809